MISRLLCKLGFHKFGLFVDFEAAPGIMIAHSKCQRPSCSAGQYEDPAVLPLNLLAKDSQ